MKSGSVAITQKTYFKTTPPSTMFKKTALTRQRTVSEQLKATRELSEQSIAECSRALGIPKIYLKAMEESRFDLLPGEVYARGWLKKYSEYLNLASKEMLEAYNSEHVVWQSISAEKKKLSTKNPHKTRWWEWFTVKRLAVGVVSVSVLMYLGFALYQSFAPPTVEFAMPLEDFQTNKNSVALTGVTEPESTVLINNNIVPLESDGSFNQSLVLRDGLQTITIEVRKQHSRSFTKTIRIVKSTPPELQ